MVTAPSRDITEAPSLFSASPTGFKLPGFTSASGLSSDSVEAKLAFSTKRPGKCDAAHGRSATMARDGHKRGHSKDTTATVKASRRSPSPKHNGCPELSIRRGLKSDEDEDKSEELSDIINFLIETDPRRSRDEYGALYASSDDAERVSSPASGKEVAICEQDPDTKGAPCQESTECPPKPTATSSSPTGIVLPAADFFGFNYQPDFTPSSLAPRASSQTLQSAHVERNDPLNSQRVRPTRDAEMSTTGSPTDRVGPLVNGNGRCSGVDLCQVPSGDVEIRGKTSQSSVNNAVTASAEKSDIANKGCGPSAGLIIKAADISQDADDSLADEVARGPAAIENCDDGRADSGVALDSPVYRDTRPCCAKEDSSAGGSRRDGSDHNCDAPGECQLRTPASSATTACDSGATSGQPVETAGGSSETDRETSSPPPGTTSYNGGGGDAVPALEDCASVCEPKEVYTKGNESGAESDGTEALEWSPGRVSRSNSAEYAREPSSAAVACDDVCDNADASAPSAGPSAQPMPSTFPEGHNAPLVNGVDVPQCTNQPTGSLAPLTDCNAPDRGLDNLISVFTTVEQGKILRVDCKKFRKRGRPPGPKRLLAMRRAQRAAMETSRLLTASDTEDVEFTVRQVLRDVVDRIVNTSCEIPSKLSEANIKEVITTFCESNGIRCQDFTGGDNDDLCFGNVLPEERSFGGRRRRIGSSDHGSSSDRGSPVAVEVASDNGTPRKRYRKRQTVPGKRMLTRSQWRRSCYQKEQDSASTDQPDNGLLLRDSADSLPDAKRWRRSVDLTSESSNPESSADALSLPYGGASQDVDMGVTAVEDASRGASDESRGPSGGCAGGDVSGSSCVLVAEKLSSAPVNSSIYLSSEPPKLGYMEASVTDAPRELTSMAAAVSGCPQDVSRDVVDCAVSVGGVGGGGHCADYSKDRRGQSSYGLRNELADGRTNGGNDDDDDESRLMICDTDEPFHDAGVSGASSVGTADAGQLRALTKTKAEKDACSAVHAGLPDSRRSGGFPAVASPVRGGGAAAVCESEKAAADTGVVCLTEENGDAGTHDATVAGGGTGGTSRALLKSPATVHSVQGSPAPPSGSCDGPVSAGDLPMSATLKPPSMGPRRAASSSPSSRTGHGGGPAVSPHCPRPASMPTAPPGPAGSPDVIVVKEEPNDLSMARRAGGGTAGGALPGGLEPLDLTVKESSFRAKSDIPVGKVQPQMTTSTSQSAQEEPTAASSSPINYSSSRQSTGQRAEDGGHSSKERERRVGQASDSNASRPHNGTGSAGTSSSEPLSDSILQRLLLDPSRKPKEVESKAASPPVPVIMDVRSLRGGITEGTPTEASKRGRDTDIVAEAKSLLNARLTARHQEQQQQLLQQQHQQQQQPPQSLVKASNMASVPPMSFPENKLGMSTLESKIVELKKQIHHLTILATYKEKELACISSLRTAKEDALKQLESKYPGICSIMRAFGPEANSGESSGDSPGFTDVPSIVAQAATATSGLSPLGTFASETDPPLQKKPAVQQPSPTLPVPLLAPAAPQRLRTNSGSERESPGRGLLPYDRGSAAVSSSTTMTSVSPRDSRQPGTSMITTAPSKSAFSVPTPSSSSLQGQRQPRLLLPKGAVPAPAQAPGSSAQATASRVNAAGAHPAGAAAVSSWWNAHNGAATALSLTSGLPHHLQREAMRDYASSSSSTAALLKAASVPSSAIKQHGAPAGGAAAVPALSKPEPASLAGASDVASRSAHRRLAETTQGRVEDARDLAAELARQQEEYNLALNSAGSLSGMNPGYPLSRAGLSAAASMYNQAMAYSLYQQLRMNKEAAAAQAETSALLEKMKHHNLPPSQQQHLYHKALLEQAKSRSTSWEHLNHLLQKDGPPGMQAGVPIELLSLQPKLSATAPELLPWLQAGLACVNCGDPRVKFVCSCCRTQTFCSEQCQVKLWNKLKAQTPAKN